MESIGQAQLSLIIDAGAANAAWQKEQQHNQSSLGADKFIAGKCVINIAILLYM